MNAGLGNLTTLKAHLLASALAEETTYDEVITALGLGVAAHFDQFCARKFARLVGAVDTFSCDRASWVVNRFPIEGITKLEQRSTLADGFVELVVNDVIWNMDEPKGLLFFGDVRGNHSDIMRVTYTGGYWFDDSEDESGTQPVGSTLLPDDLKMAWLLHCSHLWDLRDKLGINITKEPKKVSQLAESNFPPEVRDILTGYIRFMLT